MQKTVQHSIWGSFGQKMTDYKLLVKLRLTQVVIFSAVMAYLIAIVGDINWINIIFLSIGGFCVTGAANALNEVLERDYDKLMKRTANRPLATGRMSVSEGVLTAGILCLVGIVFLGLFNPIASLLGMVSLVIYAFVYTPLKRVSPLAIVVGAIPGALPVMIGCVAFEGSITPLAWALFGIQFIWQFPHFLAIGWLGHEDYIKAGYKMLPSEKPDSSVGKQAFLYALLLLPIGCMPFVVGITGIISAVIITILGIGYAYYSWQLYKKCTREAALQLMYCSFFYLPMALIILWLDKI